MNHAILALPAFVLPTGASAAFAKEPCPYSSREAWQLTVPEKYQRRAEYAFVESVPALPNVRAGAKSPGSNHYPSDGEHLKIAITDRGRFELRSPHWEPRMSLDMSAGDTVGAKVFDFALEDGEQGVTFIRLKEHDGDPVEIHGFDADDFSASAPIHSGHATRARSSASML